MVQDAATGNDFGHKESRQGDLAQGTYYVVLPDGRKQVVQYEADQEGYKPKISYEEGAAPKSGYSYSRNNKQGSQDNGGYSY